MPLLSLRQNKRNSVHMGDSRICLPLFVGDELKLQQVLINILGNAVKFTPDGGKVHLQIEQVFFNTEQNENYALLFLIQA